MRRLAQTQDNVVSECHMWWASQGARDWTVWIKNKRLWFGTLPTAFNPGNKIAISNKKIKYRGQFYLCAILEVDNFTCYNKLGIESPCFT